MRRHVDRIEAREGLVAEQDLGLHHDRAREGDAPEHAARELAREQPLDALESDGLQDPRDLRRDLGPGFSHVLAQREPHVLEHGHRIEQRAVLEQHPDALADLAELALALVREGVSRDADLARVRSLEAADHAQERALAGSTAAEQQMDLALAHPARHPVEDLALAEGEADVAQIDEGVRRDGRDRGSGRSGGGIRRARRRFAGGCFGEAFQGRSSDSESFSAVILRKKTTRRSRPAYSNAGLRRTSTQDVHRRVPRAEALGTASHAFRDRASDDGNGGDRCRPARERSARGVGRPRHALGSGSHRDPARRRRGLGGPLPRSARDPRLARRGDLADPPRHRGADPALSPGAPDREVDRDDPGALRRPARARCRRRLDGGRVPRGRRRALRDRGRVSDETLEFLRAAFDAPDDVAVSNGQPFLFRPSPTRAAASAIGGAAPHALARAVRFGDGWLPMTDDPDRLREPIRELARHFAAAGRERPEVAVFGGLGRGTRDEDLDRLAQLESLGVTEFIQGARYDGSRRLPTGARAARRAP